LFHKCPWIILDYNEWKLRFKSNLCLSVSFVGNVGDTPEIAIKTYHERTSRTLTIPPRGDVKLLTEQQDLYRPRVGAYRILFNHTEKIVCIQAIDSRGGIYK